MKTDAPYHIHVTPSRGLLDINLLEVWKYRDLAVLFTKRDFTLRYKQTILGPLWLLITPFFTAFIHVLVFSEIAGIGTDGVPSLLFYLVSNGIWGFVSGLVGRSSYTFSGNAYMFGKVYFPRLIMPISYIMVGAVEFGIKFIIFLVLILYYHFAGIFSVSPISWLLIPIYLLWLSALALGFGLTVSSLTTKYRDLHVLVSFGVSLWMYATPVVYPLSQIQNPVYRNLISYNPAAAPVELLRKAILGVGGVTAPYIIHSLIFTVILLTTGVLLFNRIEKTFMDTV